MLLKWKPEILLTFVDRIIEYPFHVIPWHLILIHKHIKNNKNENVKIRWVNDVKKILFAFLQILCMLHHLVPFQWIPLWLSSNNPVYRWKCRHISTVCCCFLNWSVISKTRQDIEVIKQCFLPTEATSGQYGSLTQRRINNRTNLKDKKAYIYIGQYYFNSDNESWSRHILHFL